MEADACQSSMSVQMASITKDPKRDHLPFIACSLRPDHPGQEDESLIGRHKGQVLLSCTCSPIDSGSEYLDLLLQCWSYPQCKSVWLLFCSLKAQRVGWGYFGHCKFHLNVRHDIYITESYSLTHTQLVVTGGPFLDHLLIFVLSIFISLDDGLVTLYGLNVGRAN